MLSDYEEVFKSHRHEAKDCAVLALAAVTEYSYLTAHHALEASGRGGQQSTKNDSTKRALEFLGFEIRRVWTSDEIALEVRAKKPTLADLEGKDWLPRLMVFVNKGDHIAPFFNGQVRDWSRDTEAVIDYAWES